jgi:hypothetical protein
MSPARFSKLYILVGGLLVVGAIAWQQRSLMQLHREVEGLREALQEDSGTTPSALPLSASPRSEPTVIVERSSPQDDGSTLEPRIAALEAEVALLGEGADHLMDRGSIPPSQEKLNEWIATFLDPSAADQDRVLALRMLRRNSALTPAMAQMAADWLKAAASSDSGLARNLLIALRGESDPNVKAAILGLAATGSEESLRDLAVQQLRDYPDDPQVSTLLWELASSDASARIRRQAESTLRRFPMTDARMASLEARALNPVSTTTERLTALRLLRGRDEVLARVAPTVAQAALEAPDSETRMAYYEAFDGVNDPSFLLPLVEGAQAAEAEVRRRAVDSLMDYRAEAAIVDLLRSMAETDPDPGVRQEAARIYRYAPR